MRLSTLVVPEAKRETALGSLREENIDRVVTEDASERDEARTGHAVAVEVTVHDRRRFAGDGVD